MIGLGFHGVDALEAELLARCLGVVQPTRGVMMATRVITIMTRNTVRAMTVSWTSNGPKSNLEGRLVRGGRSVFEQAFGDNSGQCFPGSGVVRLNAASITLRNIRGGAKQAQASFWFPCTNHDASIPDLSCLFMAFGTFDSPSTWPGEQDVTMRVWEMTGEGNTRRGSTNACLAEGIFDDTMTEGTPEILLIDVNLTQP